jgi:hypothetical protein
MIKLFHIFENQDLDKYMVHKSFSLVKLLGKNSKPMPDMGNFFKYIDDNNIDIDSGIDSLPETVLNISELTPTKNFLDISTLNKKMSLFKGLPFVIKSNNEYFIIDGHHRIALAALDGKENIKVRLFSE